MTVEDLRDQLAEMPASALVFLCDPDAEYRPADSPLLYQHGEVQIRLTWERDLLADDDEADEDLDVAVVVGLVPWRSRLVRWVGEALQHVGVQLQQAGFHLQMGVHYHYPLCCVLFFTGIWSPLARATGVHPWLQRRLQWWAASLTTKHVPCPWHRWVAPDSMENI